MQQTKFWELSLIDHEQDANKSYVKLDRDFVDAILSLKNNSTGTHGHLAQT